VALLGAAALAVTNSSRGARLAPPGAHGALGGLAGLREEVGERGTLRKTQKAAAAEPSWQTRRGSFMVIGDWGYDPVSHYWTINNKTCVTTIAAKMLEVFEMLGDVEFIINVGDSFYPDGVSSKDDPQWQTKWRDIFAPKLRSVPWYSVYGNHDYHHDPCVCTDDLTQCAQINADPNNLEFFAMPNYTYFQPVPKFNMEIVAMDLNHFEGGWDSGRTYKELGFSDCEWSPCKDKCYPRARGRSDASFELFRERHAQSQAKNLLVFSHYPTDYFIGGAPEFLDGLRNKTAHDITYFGGHRHSTDTWSTCSIEPNVNWLVGGGGGWSCDSDDQGFVVGEIQGDYTIQTYPVYVDKEVCCRFPTTTDTTTTYSDPGPVTQPPVSQPGYAASGFAGYGYAAPGYASAWRTAR